MRSRIAFLLLAAVLSSAAQPLDQKIRRVENGLVRAVLVKGRPSARMSIADRLRNYQVPGASVGVVANGELEWERGYGITAVPGTKPVTAETLFQAASISKPVAAMTAMRLVELGRLSLDEDVNLKLRSWKVPENEFVSKEKVTLRRLLSHTAGLTVHGFRGYAAGEAVPTLPQLLDGVKPTNSAAIRVNVVPGTLWRYAGGGYEVMQQLVEDVTGKPFPQVARELVLDPLGMKHSTYEQPLPERYRAAAASAHGRTGAALQGNWHTYPEMAAAGLWTTPSDLARVILEIQKPGKVVKPETARLMTTAVLGNYGLGFSLGEKEGLKSFSHGGSNEGFRCMLFAYLEGGRGAVVMTNGDRGQELAREILAGIAVEYGWPDFKPREREVVQVGAAVLQSYAGQYGFDRGPLVSLTVLDGRFYAEVAGQGRSEMLPSSADSFFDPDGRLPDMRFVKGADGSVELHAANQVAKRK